ncbi:hypothetical protein ACOMHN_026909 [Nucella lapillus]
MKRPVIALTSATPPSQTYCRARQSSRQCHREQNASQRGYQCNPSTHSCTSEPQLTPGLWTSLKSFCLHLAIPIYYGSDSHRSRSSPGLQFLLREGIPFLRGMHRLRWFQSQTIQSPALVAGAREGERDRLNVCSGSSSSRERRRKKTAPPPHFPVLVLVLTLLGTSQCTLAARAGGSRGRGGGGGGGGKKGSIQMRCPPCRQIHCAITDPKQLDCKGGVTTGVCGCCPTCARLLGESCGGEYAYLGKCDRGLTCLPPPHPSALPAYPTQRRRAGVCTTRRKGE